MAEQLKRIFLSLLGGAYVLSPIDLIPDIIPVLGLADDAAVFLLLIYLWMTWMRDDKAAPTGHSGRSGAPDGGSGGEGTVIDIKPIK
jgi:uncharacterized membrane protein YkvA (DUF1232 family)